MSRASVDVVRYIDTESALSFSPHCSYRAEDDTFSLTCRSIVLSELDEVSPFHLRTCSGAGLPVPKGLSGTVISDTWYLICFVCNFQALLAQETMMTRRKQVRWRVLSYRATVPCRLYKPSRFTLPCLTLANRRWDTLVFSRVKIDKQIAPSHLEVGWRDVERCNLASVFAFLFLFVYKYINLSINQSINQSIKLL